MLSDMKDQSAQAAVAMTIRVRLAQLERNRAWLADEMGITQHALGRRMRGQPAFSTDDLDKLAEALRINVSAFFLRTSFPQGNSQIMTEIAS